MYTHAVDVHSIAKKICRCLVLYIYTLIFMKCVGMQHMCNTGILHLLQNWYSPDATAVVNIMQIARQYSIYHGRPLQWPHMSINSLSPGRCGSNFKSIIFKLMKLSRSLGTCREFSYVNATELHQWEVNIGSGNSLVPDSTQPFPWANVDSGLFPHMAPLGADE